MAIWRVLIVPKGIRAQICLGKDPEKAAKKIAKVRAEKDIVIAKETIKRVFTTMPREKMDIIASGRWQVGDWKALFNDAEIEALHVNKAIEVAKSMGINNPLNLVRYKEIAAECYPNCLDIQVELDVKTPSEFLKTYGSDVDGALEVIDNIRQVYGNYKKPIDEVIKWIKMLQAEKESK